MNSTLQTSHPAKHYYPQQPLASPTRPKPPTSNANRYFQPTSVTNAFNILSTQLLSFIPRAHKPTPFFPRSPNTSFPNPRPSSLSYSYSSSLFSPFPSGGNPRESIFPCCAATQPGSRRYVSNRSAYRDNRRPIRRDANERLASKRSPAPAELKGLPSARDRRTSLRTTDPRRSKNRTSGPRPRATIQSSRGRC